MRNINYCRCVGYNNNVAVAKIIRENTEYLVCEHCREKQKDSKIVNLDYNVIYLCGIDCHTGE
jgi:hypothetical protein